MNTRAHVLERFGHRVVRQVDTHRTKDSDVYRRPIAPVSGIETINSHDRLNDLREEWNRFAEQFHNPLVCHEWFSSCAAAFCPPDRLEVRVLRSDGKIRAIAPLVRRRRFGVDHMELLGTAHLMEPTSFLFEDSASFEQLFRAILDLGEPLFLARILPEPDLRPVVRATVGEKSHVMVERDNSSPWIPITLSWKEFEARMTSHRRSNLRRLRRRLEAKGALQVEVHSEWSAGLARALEEALRIEGSGWKGKRGTAILSNQRLKAFFTSYGPAAARSGILRLFLLRLDGKGIAMMLGVEYARRLWILKVGYDESWSRFAPGIVLHHESIRWAFEQQLHGYEFLGTTEPWIKEWTDKTHTYSTYRIFPRSFHGFLSLGLEGTRVLMRKASDLTARISIALGSLGSVLTDAVAVCGF